MNCYASKIGLSYAPHQVLAMEWLVPVRQIELEIMAWKKECADTEKKKKKKPAEITE